MRHLLDKNEYNTFKSIIALLAVAIFILYLFIGSGERISFEKKRATEDPLFGIAGTDPEALRSAIADLEKSVDEVAGIYLDPNEQKSIKESLHPLNFLKMLPDLEEKRLKFIADPGSENYFAYRSALRDTAKNYENDLEKYLFTVKNLPKARGDEIYHYGTNAMSLKTLIGNIAKLAENSVVLRKNVDRKFIPNSARDAEITSMRPDFNLYAADLKFTDKLMEKADWQAVMPLTEVPTDCNGGPQDPDLFYLIKRPDGEMVPLSIRQMFFRFKSGPDAEARYFEPLREGGHEYIWQPDYNFYFCQDLSHHAGIHSLYRVRELLGEFRKNNESLVFSDLDEAIDEFLYSDPLWRDVQLDLFKEVDNVFAEVPRAELKQILGESSFNILHEIYLISRQNSALLDDIIRRGATLNHNLVNLSARLSEPFEVKELFMTRSYPSLYFMPYNRSIWLSENALDFTDYYADTPYYFSYKKLSSQYPDEKILDIVMRSMGLAK